MPYLKIIFVILSISLFSVTTVNSASTNIPSESEWKNALSWSGDSSSRYGYMEDLSKAFSRKYGIHIALTSEGSLDGIDLVKSNKSDMGGSGRYATDQELDLKSLVMKPMAWDALVVVVNKSNPINNITMNQLRGIFTGHISNWSELGGLDEPIELHTRTNKLSGVGYTIRKLLFANFSEDFKEGEAYKLKSSDPLETSIERNPLGIGITGISSANKKDLKILSLNGVEVNFENIKQGKYYFYRPLYLTYNPKNPRINTIKSFVKFAYSREGRQIIRNAGTVPYIDAISLVMKQIDQERLASQRGLYK